MRWATRQSAHRYQAAATLAAGCGLRQGEAFGVRLQDVDFLGHRLEVRQQVKHVTGQGIVIAPPKRGKTRTVPLPDAVATAAAEHLAAFRAGRDQLVFTNSAGGPINRRSFNARDWKPAVIAAGLEPTRDNGFHALRHHYASVLLDAGVSIRALADYLGHEDPGFTLRVYTHHCPRVRTGPARRSTPHGRVHQRCTRRSSDDRHRRSEVRRAPGVYL